MRLLFLCLGWFFVALGIVGAFLPVLPTTPFLLLAVACFARSSPKLESWLMNHPKFGPTLQNWRKHGAIPRRAKIAAVVMMSISYAIFWLGTSPPFWRAVLVAALMIGPAIFVVTRPEPGA
ncbi:YbaN family protein [Rhizobium sp. XQZ8]|uniref:YbaN family protein n=1 Tax=Rhizobium populisoli TaxID=2859785 RepID=UPI001C686FDF|nr:YbaN family protein [Rhizobium populisoli]MBW6421445.1 YbaN family protein [Rhizobium populisoli]